jgi:lipopolysaccharide/colanic/teichoic acid biosynthesis glycosyltransferase
MADILMAGGGLVLFSPVLVMLAVLIQLLDPPAFVLVQGRLKFQPWPLLRRFSLDELPVLIQVLIGECSLFEPGIRRLCRPEPAQKPEPSWYRYLVWVWIVAALLALVWSLVYA